jgi:hypothetical protein
MKYEIWAVGHPCDQDCHVEWLLFRLTPAFDRKLRVAVIEQVLRTMPQDEIILNHITIIEVCLDELGFRAVINPRDYIGYNDGTFVEVD